MSAKAVVAVELQGAAWHVVGLYVRPASRVSVLRLISGTDAFRLSRVLTVVWD